MFVEEACICMHVCVCACVRPQGLDGVSGIKVIDTDAFSNAPRPAGHITVMPHCLELLSLPAACGLSSDLQPAVAVSCQGSRWSAPIPLPGAALGGLGQGQNQQGYVPLHSLTGALLSLLRLQRRPCVVLSTQGCAR